MVNYQGTQKARMDWLAEKEENVLQAVVHLIDVNSQDNQGNKSILEV